MNRNDYISALDHEGELFMAAIDAAGPDAPVPTCPEWTVRDLVHHQGEVHRWAETVVRDAITKPSAIPDDFLGELPADADLTHWFQAGLIRLRNTLSNADPDLQCFTFLADAPPAAMFWARRQTFETGIHRADAESALGRPSPFAPAIAADGVDELLTGFLPRQNSTLRSEQPRTLQVVAADAPGVWHVTISTEPPRTVRGTLDADCTITAPASDLLLALWNRGEPDRVSITGDSSVVALFGDQVQIRWS